MNQKQLTKQIYQFLQQRDFIRIETLFFDFLVEKLAIEKPPKKDWQKIRDLLISPDGRNQQLAFQILEGQGFKSLQKELKRIILGRVYQDFNFQLNSNMFNFMVQNLEEIQATLEHMKLSLDNINQKLSTNISDEKEKLDLIQKQKEMIKNIAEATKQIPILGNPYLEHAQILASYFK